MKIYKIVMVSSVVGLLVINLVLMTKNSKKDNCIEKQRIVKALMTQKFRDISTTCVYENEIRAVNNCRLQISDDNIQLKDIVAKSPVLVFRFSIFSCSACVNFTLDRLKNYFVDFETNGKIVLIYDDENMRVSDAMFGKMPYATQNRNILGLPLEKANIPFLFILDEEMKTKQFFVPEKEMPELTDRYLSVIKERYFLK